MQHIVILGANSFIAQHFLQRYAADFHFHLFTHSENVGSNSANLKIYQYTNENIKLLKDKLIAENVSILHCAYDNTNPWANQSLTDYFLNLSSQIQPRKSIYLSSIAVLDGYRSVNGLTDAANPLSFYGRIKNKIENRLLSSGISGLKVLRVPNVLGNNGGWSDFLQQLPCVKEAYLPNKGNNTGVFIAISDLIEHIKQIILLDNPKQDPPQLLSLPSDICVFQTWNKLFKNANPDIYIKTALRGRRYSDSLLKNLIFTVISSRMILAALSASQWLSKIMARILSSKTKLKPQLPLVLHVDNTVRLIQSVNFINGAV